MQLRKLRDSVFVAKARENHFHITQANDSVRLMIIVSIFNELFSLHAVHAIDKGGFTSSIKW
jgi:hypothetical protein